MPIMMFAAMWGAIFGMFSQTTERNAEDARTPALTIEHSRWTG
jgi:hypothetical protein